MGFGLTVFELASELKDEFKVLPYGEHVTLDGSVQFSFTKEDAGYVIQFFKYRGIDLLIDYEHQSVAHYDDFKQFQSPDGKAPAAGWNGGLEARDDGLWATKGRWTPQAAKAIESGEYRYFSPVLFINNGHVRAIQSIGLTNEPRLTHIPALAARCDLAELIASFERKTTMPLKDELVGALALKADATDQEITAAVKALLNKATAGEAAAGQVTAFKATAEKVPALETQISALSDDKGKAETELTALKTQQTADRALTVETVLAYAIDTGRIKPAVKDQWKGIVERDPGSALTALKAIEVGASVPIGRITDPSKEQGGTAAIAKDDHVTACKGVAFNPDRLDQHNKAIALQQANPGMTYPEAISRVPPAKAV